MTVYYTKENLLQGFELSCAVSEKLGFLVQKEIQDNFGFTERFHRDYPDLCWIAGKNSEGEQDTDWSQFSAYGWDDMGQIIQDNGIDIEWPENEGYSCVGQVSKYVGKGKDIVIEFLNKEDGLEAAANCFLLSPVQGATQ